MCIKCELLNLMRKYNSLKERNCSLSKDKIPDLSSEFSLITKENP